MELLINISKDAYKSIQQRSTEIQAEGLVVENAILNGTPLPEGHGDLIDKLCENPGYILSKEEIIKAMEEKEDEFEKR